MRCLLPLDANQLNLLKSEEEVLALKLYCFVYFLVFLITLLQLHYKSLYLGVIWYPTPTCLGIKALSLLLLSFASNSESTKAIYRRGANVILQNFNQNLHSHLIVYVL
jgi:hypothetical protein